MKNLTLMIGMILLMACGKAQEPKVLTYYDTVTVDSLNLVITNCENEISLLNYTIDSLNLRIQSDKFIIDTLRIVNDILEILVKQQSAAVSSDTFDIIIGGDANSVVELSKRIELITANIYFDDSDIEINFKNDTSYVEMQVKDLAEQLLWFSYNLETKKINFNAKGND